MKEKDHSEFFVSCYHCNHPMCLKHDSVITVIITRTSKSDPDVKHFCSGLCITIYNLNKIIENKERFRVVDSSWFPVIENINDQLRDELKDFYQHEK